MVNLPILALFLQGIPEQIAVVTLAFVIAKITLNWKIIIGSGIFLAFLAYFVRLLPIPFGIHSIMIIVLLFILVLKLSKGNIILALLGSLGSFFALALFEVVCFKLLMSLFKITPSDFNSNLWLRIAISEPQVILIFISAFLVQRFFKGRGRDNELI